MYKYTVKHTHSRNVLPQHVVIMFMSGAVWIQTGWFVGQLPYSPVPIPYSPVPVLYIPVSLPHSPWWSHHWVTPCHVEDRLIPGHTDSSRKDLVVQCSEGAGEVLSISRGSLVHIMMLEVLYHKNYSVIIIVLGWTSNVYSAQPGVSGATVYVHVHVYTLPIRTWYSLPV